MGTASMANIALHSIDSIAHVRDIASLLPLRLTVEGSGNSGAWCVPAARRLASI
jgi:hypothetical protein